jgi:hypothetical protein
MPLATPTLGDRFAALVATECDAFDQQLLRAVERTGTKRDRAVHEGRKALQRLRAVLRLAGRGAESWVACERRVRALRRRLGRLRDAAVRVELVRKLIEHEPTAAANEHAQAALAHLQAMRARTWDGLDARFLERLTRDWQRERARLQRLSTAAVNEARVLRALEDVRRQLRRKLRAGLGATHRSARHDLRRVLRRYAAMRTAAATMLRRRDAMSARLTDAGRELGVEGDHWLTRTALLAGDHHAEVRALGRSLESQRRALCKLHDGELVALRRQALSAPLEAAPDRVAPKRTRAAAEDVIGL